MLGQHLLLLVGMLLIASDGAGYYIYVNYGLPPLAPASLGIALILIVCPPKLLETSRPLLTLLAFTTCSFCWLLVQKVLTPDFNLGGFCQVVAFLLLLAFLRYSRVFSNRNAKDAVASASLVILWVFLGYAIISHVVHALTGGDISAFYNLPSDVKRYGYRPSLLSREPSWAGLGAALMTHLYLRLDGRKRWTAVVLCVLIQLFLKSLAGLLFSLMVSGQVIVLAASMTRKIMLLTILLLCASVTIFVAGEYFTNRLSAVADVSDGSMRQRLLSMGTAGEAIVGALPSGIGYGNMQSVLGRDSAMLAVAGGELQDSYRGDSFLLTGLAELGLYFICLFLFLWLECTSGSGTAFVMLVVLGFTLGTTNYPGLAFLSLAVSERCARSVPERRCDRRQTLRKLHGWA